MKEGLKGTLTLLGVLRFHVGIVSSTCRFTSLTRLAPPLLVQLPVEDSELDAMLYDDERG